MLDSSDPRAALATYGANATGSPPASGMVFDADDHPMPDGS
jgi:hypothetical protein